MLIFILVHSLIPLSLLAMLETPNRIQHEVRLTCGRGDQAQDVADPIPVKES